MRTERLEFQNQEGRNLAARLELPVNQHPHTYALFAHCFTCSKDFKAIKHISRALTSQGFGVLRFDFTGLGSSEGDFSDTNFSYNINDLITAAQYLENNFQAPTILIGHSLGGAAAICAAYQLDYIQAVATIGAPSDPEHISHLLSQQMDQIEEDGEAEVDIGGRPFTIKKQFLEDIQDITLQEHLRNLKKALLILHSPQDRIVDIDHARQLYQNAFHPKSFISLDGADHLLTESEHSLYAGSMIAAWAQKYINKPEKEKLKAEKQVAARLGKNGYTTDIAVRQHQITADEPVSKGGDDFGPNPYELVGSGLAACTAMTLHMYARRKKWDLQEVTVHINHYKDYPEDVKNPEDPRSKIDNFDRKIIIEGNLDEKQRDRLMEIADKCPVHRTLHNPIKINTV